jgi:hypothetical protein
MILNHYNRILITKIDYKWNVTIIENESGKS